MDHTVIDLIHHGFVKNCTHNFLTDLELVQKLFAFCSKINQPACTNSVSNHVDYFNIHCKPDRRNVRINTSALLVLLTRDDTYVHERIYDGDLTQADEICVKISFKSVTRQLKQVLRVKRHKGNMNDIQGAQLSFLDSGLYFDWEEADFSASSPIRVQRVVAGDRELFVEDVETKPFIINKYIYIPIRSVQILKDESRIDVGIELQFDDTFLNDLNRNDEAHAIAETAAQRLQKLTI